jgi:hypothetical protein
MEDQKLLIDITPEYVSIVRRLTRRPIVSIVYWCKEEWEEDPETVLPAIKNAVELFLTDQVRLLEILDKRHLILTDSPEPKRKFTTKRVPNAGHGLKLDGCDFI